MGVQQGEKRSGCMHRVGQEQDQEADTRIFDMLPQQELCPIDLVIHERPCANTAPVTHLQKNGVRVQRQQVEFVDS